MHRPRQFRGINLTKNILAFLFAAVALTASAAEWHLIASLDATNAVDLARVGGAAEYAYSLGEIPASALPASSNERKIFFGQQLLCAWVGAQPAAQYKIKAVFLSDSAERLLRVDCNGRVLADSLALPRGQVQECAWVLPAGVVAAGEINLTIRRLQGANAVLSRLEIASDVPQVLGAPLPLAERLAAMDIPRLRLSPRPAALAGVRTPLISLSGSWKFNPIAPTNLATVSPLATRGWKAIEVPGEWVMQGFTVPTNTAAAYWREFTVPADWRGQRIKLRFDTVHSDSKIFVNGQLVGAQESCFTAFELDITAAVQPGRNTLALAVKSDSVADTLASASQYAAHPLGGITRKVQLFSLPPVNVDSQMVETKFDEEFCNAVLTAKGQLADERVVKNSSPVAVRATLFDGQNKVATKVLDNLNPAGEWVLALPVAAPKKWDSEHPNLYRLKTELLVAGQMTESVTQRVGFRQIAVRGNQLLVNGVPVKLRGACRHEVDPLRGRSLTPAIWKQDAALFRAANVNYIRTSHYPPPEEFLDLCDEYGFFVECEAPLCWIQHGANLVWQTWNYQDQSFFPYLLRANLANLAANRNHPCVTIWSLANESSWSPLFAEVNRRVKLADPTRPTSFHDQCWGSYNNAHSQADIAVYHYPAESGPARCDAEPRPVLFGEYCHVECYNRRELATDPGVRDDWGRGFARMNDLMDQHPGCLGGAIWAAVDDVFCLPTGKFVGYGMWGSLCDGWRREKPETWHVKKTYAPVRISAAALPLPANGAPLRVLVENRFNFSDLREVGIAWSVGRAKGKILAQLPARQRGEISLPLPPDLPAGAKLHLTFTDPRGFICNEEEIPLGTPVATIAGTTAAGRLSLTTLPDYFRITGGRVEYVIDRRTGQFISGKWNGHTVLAGGPALMVPPLQTEACEPVDLGVWKPLNAVCENWRATAVQALATPAGTVEVAVQGDNAAAAGNYVLTLDAAGNLTVRYELVARTRINPRQWGMVFFVPENFSTLRWQRQAQWSFYPADHIGRASGIARVQRARSDAPYAVRRPDGVWSADATALGGNDFSSTKVGIVSASLASRAAKLCVVSDGHQAVRAFAGGGQNGWLVTGFHTGGGDGFFSTHLAAERKPLAVGAVLSDTIQLRLADE